MKKHGEFISAYKELEDALSKTHQEAVLDRNTSIIRWAEDAYPERASKLRYCRMTRNYIQHEPDYDAFIVIADEMVEFLKGFAGELVGTAKSLSKGLRVSSVLSNDFVFEAVKKMKNRSFVLVTDGENLVGLLEDVDIRIAFLEGKLNKRTRVSSLVREETLKRIFQMSENDSGSQVKEALEKELCDAIAVVNKKGKLCGVIYS